MRDQVSWGFYIGNFAFLVGVAAAAVVLVVPAYVYDWGPIREVVLIAELLSVAAIIMCMLFVTVDVGRPEFLWHLMPVVGTPNFPHSLLTWDILVLNVYFLINWFIVTYILFMAFTGRKYNPNLVLPIIFLSIPFAIGIHTVTAFLFMGLKSRAFWHTAILAPRFITGAFCSGPALLFLDIPRPPQSRSDPDHRHRPAEDRRAARLCDGGQPLLPRRRGLHGVLRADSPRHARALPVVRHRGEASIAVYTWLALACNVSALVIFVVPMFRRRVWLLAHRMCPGLRRRGSSKREWDCCSRG